MARKPAAKAAPAKPERDPITLPEAASFTSDVRTLAVNVTILLAIVLVVPVIVTQFWRSQVVIEPIAVPGGLSETGLTAEIAAGRLWDGIEAVSASAGTAKATVVSIPESAKVDFAIPDSGLSIDSLVYYVRQFFHVYETRVSGEFRCADPSCAPEGVTLRIRVIDDDVNLIDMPARGDKSEDTYFREAAAEVLSYLDPFTALAAVSTTDPARGKVLARRLIRTNHPDAKWAYNLLGTLLTNDGDTDGAIEQFNAALAIDPDFAPALANLGSALLAKQDLPGAKSALDRVLARNKDDVYALQGYADLTLAQGGSADEAVKYLLQASKVRPLPPYYINLAGNVMLNAGRQDEAIGYFRQALEVDPGDQLALAMLGALYGIAGKFDEAERVYRAAADFAPTNAEILADHVSLLRVVQKFDEALEKARVAISRDPDNPRYHALTAKVLMDLARYDEALVELAEAQRLRPDDPEDITTLADILRLQGKTAEAIAAYNKVKAMVPADDDLARMADAYLTLLGAASATPEAQPGAAASTQP